MQPGRKPKLDAEKLGSNIGVSTWATSLLDDSVHHGRNPQHSFAAIGLGYLYPSHRLRLVPPIFDLRSQRWPVLAQVGGEVFNGYAVNARRPFVGLHPLPCLAQVVAVQYRLQQILVDCFHFALVSRLGAWPAPRHLAQSGSVMLSRWPRLLLVFCCSALHWPDFWPITMASTDFCTVTTHIAAGRAVHLDDVCCLFLRHAAGSTLRRSGLGIPVEPIRVLSSSSRTARGADIPR